ncbi:protein mono-ADP-ribosyltransferase PARP12-like [Pecten maximus]|uniref:protein mono-ADP-ribosyltransferase PARP12-like n=1 Tax=Pecten maximus TaxID=6579 RepID=UPI0014585629|nr:protein mono-ADP-ribosyltransferase PARP12-like [Pecten maximus]
MQNPQNLIQINFVRAGKYGARGSGHQQYVNSRGRGNERRHSSSSACPYTRNSPPSEQKPGCTSFDYGHGRSIQIPQLPNQEEVPKPLSKKEIKRQHYRKTINDAILAESLSAQKEPIIAIENLSCRDLVSEVVKRLIRLGGTASIDQLKDSVFSDRLFKEVEKLSNDGTLEGLLKDNREMFAVTHLGGNVWQDGETEELDTTVTYNFNLQICKINGTKPGSCISPCSDLHLCKFHIMSKCTTLGCKFGHGEELGHNDDVLRHHFLDRLTREEVCGQLLSLQNRRGLTVPEVCTFYNARGCSKNQACTFLHVCRYYILDRCEFSSRCKRPHNLSDTHTQSVLKLYGLKDISDKRIKEFLKRAYTDPNVNKGNCSENTPEDGTPCPRWIMRGQEEHGHNLRDSECRQLEQMYREYLAVVQRTTTISGQSVHVNFAQMTARLEGSQWGVELMRLPYQTVPWL